VLDPLGHMFNKEAVLAALLAKKLDKKPLPPGLEHVKSLKVQCGFGLQLVHHRQARATALTRSGEGFGRCRTTC
jgi:hypothetical protein